ncbi:MAG: hypothetical protein IJ300_11340 [Clostridia bacterium]|nr:hypothetical protein [Clostridia bacterium]
MGQARNWTKEEIDYLSESWGRVSVTRIAEKLGRNTGAVMQRASKIGLGSFFESGDYITLHQLLLAVTGSRGGNRYILKSWVANRGLPIHNKRLEKKVVRVVYLEDFWQWAEANRSFIDFSKMEPLILGEEPQWLVEQRKKDAKAFRLQRKDAWTPFEDEKLVYYLKQHKYTYAELSKMLCRSCGAIQRRCTDLGIRERPVKADNRGPASVWTAEMYAILADGIRNGDSYMVIADALGKSEKAVRGKVYNMYFTEDADKVRAMLQNGEWGSGRPEVRVKQAAHLSEFRTETRKQLSIIVGLLRYRMNELGYEPYWQRYMCMKWDDLYGCKAGCENCDECTEFERIPEQYCARCGCTFFERAKNRFCNKCRIARKKKAQKHWAMNKKG